MAWHVPGDTLVRYATAPEAIDDITASSVEQHLLACAACRASVAGAADRVALEASWQSIAVEIDQPRSPLGERVLGRIGVPAGLARLVGATPGLRFATLVAVVLLGAVAVLTARDTGSDAPFLVLAPLVPLGAVSVAFLPFADPAGEAGVATPLHGPGLALRRTLVVLVPTVVVLTLLGFAVPGLAGWSVVWILPGLGLVAFAFALSTYVRIPTAIAVTAAAWFAVLAGCRAGGPRVVAADLPVFQPAGQLAFLAVVVIALSVVVARRDRFATMEVTW